MSEPDRPSLDDEVADRLLDGGIDPQAVPAGWEQVAVLVRAAGEVPPGDDPAPAELLTAAASRPGPAVARRRLGAAIGLGVVALLSGTGAAAAGGHLPDPMQDAVHGLAGAVGLDVPESGSQDGDGHGRSDEAPGRPDEPGPPTSDTVPGRSEEAPGAPEEPGAPATTAPGRTGEVRPPASVTPSSTTPSLPPAAERGVTRRP